MRLVVQSGAPPGRNDTAAPEADFRDGGRFSVRGVFSGKRQSNNSPPNPAPQVAIIDGSSVVAIVATADAARALRALKNGASLQLFYERGRPAWRLSTGKIITPEIAEVLTRDPNVAGAGDNLFGDCAASQTFTWQLENDHE